jgi:hypothetical protein
MLVPRGTGHGVPIALLNEGSLMHSSTVFARPRSRAASNIGQQNALWGLCRARLMELALPAFCLHS